MEEALDEVEEDKDDSGDTFPLVLNHVGLGEGLELILCTGMALDAVEEALDEVEEALDDVEEDKDEVEEDKDKVEEDKDNFGDTFPLSHLFWTMLDYVHSSCALGWPWTRWRPCTRWRPWTRWRRTRTTLGTLSHSFWSMLDVGKA